jgi:hypothetical protein
MSKKKAPALYLTTTEYGVLVDWLQAGYGGLMWQLQPGKKSVRWASNAVSSFKVKRMNGNVVKLVGRGDTLEVMDIMGQFALIEEVEQLRAMGEPFPHLVAEMRRRRRLAS